MTGLVRAVRRLRGGAIALWRRDRLGRDVDAELGAYVEACVDEKMRAGMSHGEARRAVRLEVGSPAAVKDRVLDVGWESLAESVWLDARDGARSLVRSPGFTTTVI